MSSTSARPAETAEHPREWKPAHPSHQVQRLLWAIGEAHHRRRLPAVSEPPLASELTGGTITALARAGPVKDKVGAGEALSLDLSVSIHGGCARVGLVGDLNASTVPYLLERVLALADEGSRSIVIGLGGVEVVDAHGVAALASAATLLHHLGGEMVLESPRPHTLKLLYEQDLGTRFVIR